MFNASTPDAVIAYFDAGNLSAVIELLEQEALVHESCMNQRTADCFHEVVELVYEEDTKRHEHSLVYPSDGDDGAQDNWLLPAP